MFFVFPQVLVSEVSEADIETRQPQEESNRCGKRAPDSGIEHAGENALLLADESGRNAQKGERVRKENPKVNHPKNFVFQHGFWGFENEKQPSCSATKTEANKGVQEARPKVC